MEATLLVVLCHHRPGKLIQSSTATPLPGPLGDRIWFSGKVPAWLSSTGQTSFPGQKLEQRAPRWAFSFQGKVSGQRQVPEPGLSASFPRLEPWWRGLLGYQPLPVGCRNCCVSVMSGNSYRPGWVLEAHSGPGGPASQQVGHTAGWATQQGGPRSEGSPGKEQSAAWQYQPWPEPREDLSQREDSEPQIRQETPNSVYLD